MYFFYNFCLYILYPLLLIAAIFSQKLRQNIKIRLSLPRIQGSSEKNNFWFHAASVGEYEQVRPLILKIKKEQPEAVIFVSVLSYSGYTQCQEEIIDFFFALPFDFYFRIKRLIRNIRPKLICYARYDVWPNMARAAHRLGVKQILISATLSENSMRNRFPFFRFYHKVYGYLDEIFTVDELHQKRFYKMGLDAMIAGDTRYDAIQNRLNDASHWKGKVADIKKIMSSTQKKIFIAGSTYDTSEEFLIEFMEKFSNEILLILAPHHTNSAHIQKIEHQLKEKSLSYIKYTDLKKPESDFSVLLVDAMGILLYLYSMAHFCYVGGGWEGSVHSVIEAAFFEIPILTGPRIKNSQDALDLKEIGLVETMKNADPKEVESWYLSLFSMSPINENHTRTAAPPLVKMKDTGEKVAQYIQIKANATKKIYTCIEQPKKKASQYETYS